MCGHSRHLRAMSKPIRIISVTVLLVFTAACCHGEHDEPERPSSERGWQEFEAGTVQFIGTLLLKEGESTDNGQIGVTIVKIVSPDHCAERDSYLDSPRAKLKFFRPSDEEVLCETTVSSNVNALLDSASYCGDGFTPTAISVIAISTKDKWVHFSLMK